MATKYINPSFAVNGDGSTYTLAASPGAAGAYNTWSGVTTTGANTFLQAAGTTYAGKVVISGGGTSAANRLIVGSYDAATGVETDTRAIINGTGQDASIAQAAAFGYCTVRNIEMTGGSRGFAHGSGAGVDVLVEDCYIHDIVIGAHGDGVQIFADGARIRNCTIENIANNAIYAEGDNLVITGNTIRNVSTASVGGDSIQIATSTISSNNPTITNNHIDHSSVDVKQCIIIKETDGSTGGLVEGNTCVGPAASSSHLCILLEQDNIICRGNRVTAGQDGIHVSDGTTGITISGNLITGCVRDGIALGTTGAEVLNLYNNTIVGCDNGINQGSAAATGAGAVTNCLAIDCTTYGIYIGGAAVATTNNAYGNGTNYGGFSPPAGNLQVDPVLGTDYSLGNEGLEDVGTWLAGVMLYDGLPQPLRPPMGAVARRDLAAQRHRRQALRRALGTESIRI